MVYTIRKRQDAVAKLLLESRHLQATGDFERALAHVEEGLALYPTEQRLLHRREVIKTALRPQVAQAAIVDRAVAPEMPEAASGRSNLPVVGLRH